MSDHTLPVFRVGQIRPWPGADQLDQIEIGGYVCAVKRGDFKEGDLAVYIEPDFLVPLQEPEFAFLRSAQHPLRYAHRISARRLRGHWSQGLVIKARHSWEEGQDVREALGIIRFVPLAEREPSKAGWFASRERSVAPNTKHPVPYYDIERARRHHNTSQAFLELAVNDLVATEKIHGANMAVVYQDCKLNVRSRTVWRRKPGLMTALRNVWRWITRKSKLQSWFWRAVRQNQWIESLAQAFPGVVFYGEIYGPDVQGSTWSYGKGWGQFGYVLFDALDTNGAEPRWWSFEELVEVSRRFSAKVVPYTRLKFLFDPQLLQPTGPSMLHSQIFREGWVYRGWSKNYQDAPGSRLPGQRLMFKDICPRFLAEAYAI